MVELDPKYTAKIFITVRALFSVKTWVRLSGVRLKVKTTGQKWILRLAM